MTLKRIQESQIDAQKQTIEIRRSTGNVVRFLKDAFLKFLKFKKMF
jgi:hypothetical protein